MTVLIHVTGSDIPRHNHTVICGFNDTLAAASEHARELWLLAKTNGFTEALLGALGTVLWRESAGAGDYHAKRKQIVDRFFFHGPVQHQAVAGASDA